MSFEFKTRSLSGVLFYLNNENDSEFVGVEIASGFLTYHIKCRRLEAVLTVAAAKVDDGEWHKVGCLYYLSLNETAQLSYNLVVHVL